MSQRCDKRSEVAIERAIKCVPLVCPVGDESADVADRREQDAPCAGKREQLVIASNLSNKLHNPQVISQYSPIKHKQSLETAPQITSNGRLLVCGLTSADQTIAPPAVAHRWIFNLPFWSFFPEFSIEIPTKRGKTLQISIEKHSINDGISTDPSLA